MTAQTPTTDMATARRVYAEHLAVARSTVAILRPVIEAATAAQAGHHWADVLLSGEGDATGYAARLDRLDAVIASAHTRAQLGAAGRETPEDAAFADALDMPASERAERLAGAEAAAQAQMVRCATVAAELSADVAREPWGAALHIKAEG